MINRFSTSFEGSFFQLNSFEKNSENPTCSAFQSKINSLKHFVNAPSVMGGRCKAAWIL